VTERDESQHITQDAIRIRSEKTLELISSMAFSNPPEAKSGRSEIRLAVSIDRGSGAAPVYRQKTQSAEKPCHENPVFEKKSTESYFEKLLSIPGAVP